MWYLIPVKQVRSECIRFGRKKTLPVGLPLIEKYVRLLHSRTTTPTCRQKCSNSFIKSCEITENQLLLRELDRASVAVWFVQLSQSYSTKNTDSNKTNYETSLTEGKEETHAPAVSIAENIKETTTTLSYTGIVLVGFGIAFAVIYAVLSELFSSKSAHSVYSKALAYVISDNRVRNVFGDQIKGFGEESRRGRRQHVQHMKYSKDDKNYLRMKFYIKGNRDSGVVNLEMVENEKGAYEYRYLVVNTDGISPKVITLEDNRSKFDIDDVVSYQMSG